MSISEQNLEAKSMSIPEQNLEAPNQIGLKGQMPFDVGVWNNYDIALINLYTAVGAWNNYDAYHCSHKSSPFLAPILDIVTCVNHQNEHASRGTKVHTHNRSRLLS